MSLTIKFAEPTKASDPRQIKLIGGGVALVDEKNYNWLKEYAWRAIKSQKCTYALRRIEKDGRYTYFRMHREIAKTPDDKHCHHINHNPLDNREVNLLNLLPDEHKKYHGQMFF